MKSFRYLAMLCILTLIIPITGCATARLNRFNTFAQAGISYTAASDTVIQAAGEATINTDSALLVKHRPDLNESTRRSNITTQNHLLKQRLAVLQLISAHGKLLQAYFEALAALSDPKATDTVGPAAQGVYDALAKVSPDLKNAKMGTTSVSDFLPIVSAPVVANFKVHALNKELRTRSVAITNELALQEAAFKAIESELKTDIQVQQNIRETSNIDQFASDKALPGEWSSERRTILMVHPAITSVDAAAKAAAHLRSAYTALVENRFDNTDFQGVMSDVSNILAITQKIQAAVR